MPVKLFVPFLILINLVFISSFKSTEKWQSKFVRQNKDGSLEYIPDEKGNIIPDFSRVGYYHGDKEIPSIPVVKTIYPSGKSQDEIQNAVDDLAERPLDKNGFRGTVMLKRGVYKLDQIKIRSSGIVIRGEGAQTRLIAAGTINRPLIDVQGIGNMKEVAGTRTKIIADYLPVGAKSFDVASAKGYQVGDRIIVYRPGTDAWVHDLKMDQIEERNGTRQWKASEYNLQFEREITKVEGNKISIDNPIVMAMETKYGGGEIYQYSFEGRISNVGIENLYCESEFEKDTSENHSWDAIHFEKIENGWVRNVTAKYFAYSCVHLDGWAKNISVLDCGCYDHKSVITGGRRYSFCNEGQQNLFVNCHATDGRHDFVTQARTCGPNVFYHCDAKKTHADIGPHHRWSSGTLYDNIVTDGEINIQDRGNYGSGHGWVGITQVLWNCTAKKATVQSPWVNGKNYCIALTGEKARGRFKDRPDGEWEGQNQDGLVPVSLYSAQLNARKK